MSQFIYLLNALESAAQGPYPAELGYGKKRDAVLAYVADLERTVALLRKPSSAPTEVERIETELRAYLAANGYSRESHVDGLVWKFFRDRSASSPPRRIEPEPDAKLCPHGLDTRLECGECNG